MYIDTGKASGDSLEIGAPGIHEGASFIVYFRPGLTGTSLITNIRDENTESNFYELGYNISENDTSLRILHYNKEKNIIGQTKYLRSPKNAAGSLQFIVNKTLFAGKYRVKDNSGKISYLTFTNDGRVVGLPGVQEYYVLTDFIAGPENNVDQVCFDIQTNHQQCYAFEMEQDTIRLFGIKAGTDLDLLQKGPLQYELVTQP